MTCRAVAALTLLGAAALCAVAGAAEDSLEARLAHCAGLANDAERLACYDSLTQSAPGPARAENGFGEEFLQRDAPGEPADPVESIAASLEQVRQRPFGEHVFHLGNGHVWTELEPGRGRYQVGMDVTIERTMFGSYVLSTESGRGTRVRRLE